MCKQISKSQLFSQLDEFFHQPPNELAKARVKHFFLGYPQQAFSLLLLDYFAAERKINAATLEKKMFPLAPEIYLALINFLYHLEVTYLSLFQSQEQPAYLEQLPYLRRFCRAMLLKALEQPGLPLSGQRRIQAALTKMLQTDGLLQKINLEAKLPFESREVISKLSYYLSKADLLADSPLFLPIYFTSSELEPISYHLSTGHFNHFSRKYICSLLEKGKDKQIYQVLRQMMYQEAVVSQAKMAYAVYLTLNQWDWVDHPFIRRFIANSYLEAKVAAISK